MTIFRVYEAQLTQVETVSQNKLKIFDLPSYLNFSLVYLPDLSSLVEEVCHIRYALHIFLLKLVPIHGSISPSTNFKHKSICTGFSNNSVSKFRIKLTKYNLFLGPRKITKIFFKSTPPLANPGKVNWDQLRLFLSHRAQSPYISHEPICCNQLGPAV